MEYQELQEAATCLPLHVCHEAELRPHADRHDGELSDEVLCGHCQLVSDGELSEWVTVRSLLVGEWVSWVAVRSPLVGEWGKTVGELSEEVL